MRVVIKYINALSLGALAYYLSAVFCVAEEANWVRLEAGVENVSFYLNTATNSTDSGGVPGMPASVSVLRLDPTQIEFELLMASELGKPRTLSEWAAEYDLIAAINASMYLPDGLTSTGYMRRNEYANNNRVVSGFGAFFVAEPDSADLPAAAVLDRTDDDWNTLISHYKIVVQNFRMVSPEGVPLWKGTAKPFSIAALGQDYEGRILFLHSAQPLTANVFVQGVLGLPLGIKRLMYVEGGYQAAMLVNTPTRKQIWLGSYSPLLRVSGLVLLPNVIGVKRKSGGNAASAAD